MNLPSPLDFLLELPGQYSEVPSGQYGGAAGPVFGGAGTWDRKVPVGSAKERFPDPKGTVSKRKGSQERLMNLLIHRLSIN